jgi:hypothetical protein
MSVSYKKEVRSSERPGSAPRGLKSSASAPSTPGTRSSSRSGETSSQSYVEFKRLQDKKEMDAIRKARREENMAFSVSKQVKVHIFEKKNDC